MSRRRRIRQARTMARLAREIWRLYRALGYARRRATPGAFIFGARLERALEDVQARSRDRGDRL